MSTVSFTVYGKPEPQGSTRAFIPKGWTRPVITSTNKALKPYRQQVASVALEFCQKQLNRLIPFGKHERVEMELTFYFLRPPSVPKKRTGHVVKPDIDKLIRSVSDSLTGIVYQDDAQVAAVSAMKLYGSPERTEIIVRPL